MRVSLCALVRARRTAASARTWVGERGSAKPCPPPLPPPAAPFTNLAPPPAPSAGLSGAFPCRSRGTERAWTRVLKGTGASFPELVPDGRGWWWQKTQKIKILLIQLLAYGGRGVERWRAPPAPPPPCNFHGLGLRGGEGKISLPHWPFPSCKLPSTCGVVGWGVGRLGGWHWRRGLCGCSD